MRGSMRHQRRALTEGSLEGDDAAKLGAVDGANTVRPLRTKRTRQ